MRKTKIVCTLGPATNNVETIKELIKVGMDAARINFSHGDYESHKVVIQNLKQAREELSAPVSLILDTKGPEIRIGDFKESSVYLEQGKKFVLTTKEITGDAGIVHVNYRDLPRDLKVNSRVLIDDGLIELKVINLTDTDIECEVINSGFLSSKKGVNVPDVYVNLPSLTKKDIEDIKFGIEQGFDFIAASFIRSAKDVLKIREVLEENNGFDVKIIAKIESRDGVNNIDSILQVSDGIMVARGDLGVEIPPEEVPLVQKLLIRKSNEQGKPVITATQMLESMVNNPRPTRAEANDVAHAIFDGTDAVMLSGETAKGSYPLESVSMMSRISVRTEKSIDYLKGIYNHHLKFKTNITNAIAYAACTTAADIEATCIIAITNSGITPRMVSKFRPSCTIYALTSNPSVWRQLNLTWGCVPDLSEQLKSTGGTYNFAVDKSLDKGLTKKGDYAIIVAGVPVGVVGATNLLKVETVGDILLKGKGIGERVISGTSNVIRVTEQAEVYFKQGDILVTRKTSDELLPYIKKCSAMIVGSDIPEVYDHAETVAKALDIPLIICNEKVIDVIPNGCHITVDSKNGFVYNGNKVMK